MEKPRRLIRQEIVVMDRDRETEIGRIPNKTVFDHGGGEGVLSDGRPVYYVGGKWRYYTGLGGPDIALPKERMPREAERREKKKERRQRGWHGESDRHSRAARLGWQRRKKKVK